MSISSIRDRVTEGDTIVFTVTRDLATDQASSITLTLTHNGDFFSPRMDTLNLTNPINPASINLNLTNRNQRNGKVYYYLDRNGNSNPDPQDQVSHDLLDELFNGGADTVDTHEDDGHIGDDDERSVIIDDYAVVLPTDTEIRTFLATGIPGGWRQSTRPYWAAGVGFSPSTVSRHDAVQVSDGSLITFASDDTSLYHAFFQVLTAQRTIIVDLPAEPMGTVTVEVATIDMDDFTTDGSLIAELTAVTSPIELGNTVSKVAILHNNLEVTITGPNEASSISVGEGSDVDLVIKVEPSVPNDRPLDVNLSYVDVIFNTMETTAITVLAGSTSQDFQISVGDDDIAAQPTRIFNVSITPDINYAVGTPSSVAVSVLDNDTATVSILPVRDPITEPITEGNEAQFEVQVDKEIAVDLIVGIALETTGGDFGISSRTNVVIAKSTTTALLRVGTDDDEIGEAYGSLTATIVSLDSQEPVSGPLVTSANNSSATVTILDDDLIVSITASDNIIQDSTTVSESDEVSLHLILSDAINRPLQVNLSYMDDFRLLATGAPSFVVVPVNTTTHPFTVPIINDRIAAQPERNINISVATGLGYTASTDSVTVTVVDDDVARVSISAASNRVIEGDTIIFEITRDLAAAQATSITLTLTHDGDFFSPARDTLTLGNDYADTGH